jgi:hypothetical protein
MSALTTNTGTVILFGEIRITNQQISDVLDFWFDTADSWAVIHLVNYLNNPYSSVENKAEEIRWKLNTCYGATEFVDSVAQQLLDEAGLSVQAQEASLV